MTQHPRWVLAVDPGAQHTGVVLCRLVEGVLSPIDGVSVQRLNEERPALHKGGPTYGRRVLSTLYEMLDKHGVGDDGLMVAVETVVLPTGFAGPRVWLGLIGTNGILLLVAGAWPDAALVAPDRADKKPGYPPALWRHHPKSWMGHGGSDKREHQRSAFMVAVAGLHQAGHAFTAAVVSAPGAGQKSFTLVADSTEIAFNEAADSTGTTAVDKANLAVAVAVAAIRLRLKTEQPSYVLLAGATKSACPEMAGEDLVDLALAASQVVMTRASAGELATLRARLAAELALSKSSG